MCWVGNRKNIRRKIAKEDMTVLKLCAPVPGFGVSSNVFDYYYKSGKVQPRVRLRAKRQPNLGKNCYTISEGYHSYSPKDVENLNGFDLFLIPKGTKYVENNQGDIVSETIVLSERR